MPRTGGGVGHAFKPSSGPVRGAAIHWAAGLLRCYAPRNDGCRRKITKGLASGELGAYRTHAFSSELARAGFGELDSRISRRPGVWLNGAAATDMGNEALPANDRVLVSGATSGTSDPLGV